MYGYDGKSEYARLRTAAEQGRKIFDTLVEPTLRNYDKPGKKGEAGKTEQLGQTDLLRLLYALAQLHAVIPHDGKTWQQHPYDMLAHIAMLTEGSAKERQQQAFDLCCSWEKAAAMLCYADKMRRLYERMCKGMRANRDAQDRINQQNVRLEAIMHMLQHPEAQRNYAELQAELVRQERETRPRVTYDVFDQKISYNERIARWQEDNSIHDQSDTSNFVALPEMFYSETYMRNTPNDTWMELAVFSCMLYRHLRALGVTAQQLEEKDKQAGARDYWVLAGGSEGFGLYQRRIQPESFFKRVNEAANALRCPPVRLVMANDVWMAWMSPAAYSAFEETEQAVRDLKQAVAQPALSLPDVLSEESVTDDEWKERCANALTAWMTVHNQPVETLCIGTKPNTEEQRYCLYTLDDGGLGAATSLHIRMVAIRDNFRKRNAEDRNNTLFLAFCAEGNGDVARWLSPDEEIKSDWVNRGAEYVKQLVQAFDGSGKPQRDDLKLMGSAKNWKKNAARLLLGYLAWCRHGKYGCTLGEESDPKTLAEALAEAIRADEDGKQYLNYCSFIKPGIHQLVVTLSRDEASGEMKLSLELQKRAGLMLEEEQNCALYSILTAKDAAPGEWTMDAIRRELEALDAYTGLNSENIPIAMNKRARMLGCFVHTRHKAIEFGFSWHFFGDPEFPRDAAVDVIRHEYAHYMNFVRGNKDVHGDGWKRCCEEIGAVPEATYNEMTRVFLEERRISEEMLGGDETAVAVHTPDILNQLYAEICTFLGAEDKLHGKIDLDRVLYRDANNRLANDAKAYFMLVMQWWLHRGAGRKLPQCCLVLDAESKTLAYVDGDAQQPLTPFADETDMQDFLAYVEEIRQKSILRALKIAKKSGEEGCYEVGMSSVSGKISDAEQAVLNAVMLQGGKDKGSYLTAEEYKVRLTGLDCAACSSLLDKGLNVLKEDCKAEYESAHLIEQPAREQPANVRALRFLLLVLLYRLSDGGKLYDGRFVLTKQGKICNPDGTETILTLTETDMPGFCALLEKLYVRRQQPNVKYVLSLRLENGMYTGEIINISRKKKEEKKAKQAA